MVELVGLGNMPVKRGGVELGQQINPAQAGVDAVGNGNVHQPVFTGQGNRRFRSFLGQREQPLALPAAHDDGKHIAGVYRLPASV